MTTGALHTSARRITLAVLLLAAAAPFGRHALRPREADPVAVAGAAPVTVERASVRRWTIRYESHDGLRRLAYVLLPSWYGPRRNPQLPLVISPHGRAATGLSNSKFFGDLPGVGRFAVVSPDGMGREKKLFSYGYPGQIDDLARMPRIVERALPWLRVDHTRVYALGSSMGGQETALLVARHPRLLAGAAVMDAVTDLSRRYRQLPDLPCDRRCLERWGQPYGLALQSNLRRETGGTPDTRPAAYAARSALSQVDAIAASGVPVQIWWSRQDSIVFDQEHQSQALYRAIRRANPCAPVSAFAGAWKHSTEMRATALLPVALKGFGLLERGVPLPASVRHSAAPACVV